MGHARVGCQRRRGPPEGAVLPVGGPQPGQPVRVCGASVRGRLRRADPDRRGRDPRRCRPRDADQAQGAQAQLRDRRGGLRRRRFAGDDGRRRAHRGHREVGAVVRRSPTICGPTARSAATSATSSATRPWPSTSTTSAPIRRLHLTRVRCPYSFAIHQADPPERVARRPRGGDERARREPLVAEDLGRQPI